MIASGPRRSGLHSWLFVWGSTVKTSHSPYLFTFLNLLKDFFLSWSSSQIFYTHIRNNDSLLGKHTFFVNILIYIAFNNVMADIICYTLLIFKN